jgi:hypothetical protein
VPTPYKIVFDCADPHLLAGFWAAALDWVVEDNSPLISRLMNVGAVDPDDVTKVDGRSAWRAATAVRDPDAAFDEASGVGLGGGCSFRSCRSRRWPRTGYT